MFLNIQRYIDNEKDESGYVKKTCSLLVEYTDNHPESPAYQLRTSYLTAFSASRYEKNSLVPVLVNIYNPSDAYVEGDDIPEKL